MEIRIQIEQVKKPDGFPVAPYKYRVLFEGQEIGSWRDPECSAARRLIELSLAKREDVLLTFRGDNPCMRGSVGWFADRRVADDDRGLHFARWKPFPGVAGQPQNPSD
jgi:hypothetical protein